MIFTPRLLRKAKLKCLLKQAYADFDAAEAAAERVQQEACSPGEVMISYRCPLRPHYHLAHLRGTKLSQADRRAGVKPRIPHPLDIRLPDYLIVARQRR